MYELLLLIILSIIFTSITFVFSVIMIKKLNITHPKNRFWIYTISLFTAFSIFSFSFISIGSSVDTDDKINDYLNKSEGEYCSVVMVIEETGYDNQEYKLIDAQFPFHNSLDDSKCKTNNLNHLQINRIITIFSNLIDDPSYKLSNIFPEYYDNPPAIASPTISNKDEIITSSIRTRF